MQARYFSLAASMASLWLAGCASLHSLPSVPAHVLAEPVTEQDLADANNSTIWGVYSKLQDQTLSSPRNGGTDITWRWLKPGQVMHEIWQVKGISTPINLITMWRGEPGELYAQTNGMNSLAWHGRVQPDGSVLFTGDGPLSTDFQVGFAADGTLEMRSATIQNGQLVALEEAKPTDRYVNPEQAVTLAGGNQRVVIAPSAASGSARSASAVVATQAGANQPSTNAIPTATASQTAEQAAKELAEIEARVKAAKQTLAQAKTTAEKAELSAKSLAALEAISKPPPRRQPTNDKLGDFWAYCYYQELHSDGKEGVLFISNPINERIWNIQAIYPPTEQGRAEVIAYHDRGGPNTLDQVLNRFKAAMRSSGLVPTKGLAAGDCYIQLSRWRMQTDYANWLRKPNRQVQVVTWPSLSATHIEGTMKLPTPKEVSKIKQEAEKAKSELTAAQDAVNMEERRLAQRKEQAQREKDCAAGVASACAARGTPN